jgi:hypothetical protein
MNKLVKRVFCPQCGAVRICQGRSRHAVCPNGHGRLVPRFSKAERRKAIAAKLPQATRVGRRVFVIEGRKGRFGYRDGSGRRAAAPDAKTQPGEVVARHVTAARTLIRVFAPKPQRKTRVSSARTHG